MYIHIYIYIYTYTYIWRRAALSHRRYRAFAAERALDEVVVVLQQAVSEPRFDPRFNICAHAVVAQYVSQYQKEAFLRY
jgi:hypothetical protein